MRVLLEEDYISVFQVALIEYLYRCVIINLFENTNKLICGENMRIVENKIKCKKCGDILESKSVHDFKFCKCGAVAVDGGHDYLRRCGNRDDWEELSVTDEIE